MHLFTMLRLSLYLKCEMQIYMSEAVKSYWALQTPKDKYL